MSKNDDDDGDWMLNDIPRRGFTIRDEEEEEEADDDNPEFGVFVALLASRVHDKLSAYLNLPECIPDPTDGRCPLMKVISEAIYDE